MERARARSSGGGVTPPLAIRGVAVPVVTYAARCVYAHSCALKGRAETRPTPRVGSVVSRARWFFKDFPPRTSRSEVRSVRAIDDDPRTHYVP